MSFPGVLEYTSRVDVSHDAWSMSSTIIHVETPNVKKYTMISSVNLFFSEIKFEIPRMITEYTPVHMAGIVMLVEMMFQVSFTTVNVAVLISILVVQTCLKCSMMANATFTLV